MYCALEMSRIPPRALPLTRRGSPDKDASKKRRKNQTDKLKRDKIELEWVKLISHL